MEEYDLLLKNLRESTRGVLINFVKTDGTVRAAFATLNSALIPSDKLPSGPSKRVQNPEVQSVWDTEKAAWISFRWDRLTAFVNQLSSVPTDMPNVRIAQLIIVRETADVVGGAYPDHTGTLV